LREINDTNWEFAQRLLQCVSVVSRPLRVEELAECLAFDLKAGPIPKFCEDWRPEDPLEAVLSTCATLLALVHVGNSQVIQFSHFSVKEFLASTRFADKCDTISGRYHVSSTPAHTLVAQICLGILLLLDENITQESLKKFPLAIYAGEHWLEHASSPGVSQSVEEAMKRLFDPRKQHLAAWVWIHEPNPVWRLKQGKRPSRPCQTSICYAVFCGLHTIVNSLATEHPEDLRSQDVIDKSTPLHLASREGRLEAARILVEHGADVSAQDEYRSTPLHWASRWDQVEISRLLIEHGADVAAQDNDQWTPLHEASRWGKMEAARLLVEFGADVKAQDKRGFTPLHHASLGGSEEVARFLIKHGADVTAQDTHGSTPLHFSVLFSGYMGLVQLLVDHGADPGAKNKHGATPLRGASKAEIVQFLTESGGDVTARDKHESTPSQEAKRSKDLKHVRFLEEHSANAIAQATSVKPYIYVFVLVVLVFAFHKQRK
jgi:ankyrin repeat protein